jgi:ubiquinone/menaquinone biosynthesis C-methylase UbiE
VTRVHHPLFARFFDRLTAVEEPDELEHRQRMVAGLRGRVLEVGAGNGRNLRLYEDVDEVVLVEPESFLRTKAEAAAREAAFAARVVDATADALPFEDASFDAVVFCLVLCSVPSQAVALAEARRVLRPGGELRVYEHVRGQSARTARMQRALDATVWPRLFGNCHTHRDTGAAVEAAGFTLEASERLRVSPCPVSAPVAPHLLAWARRPA